MIIDDKDKEILIRYRMDQAQSALKEALFLRDPVSGEIGKSIIFAVSQNHAAKLAQILNQMADRMFPGKYQSDFAVQVTSQITDPRQFTINFSNNNLLGSANFLSAYEHLGADILATTKEETVGFEGMKSDHMFFEKFEDTVRENETIVSSSP